MNNIKKVKSFFTARRTGSKYFMIIPIAIYILITVCTSLAARSSVVISIGDNVLPISSFAGVLSSIGNICLILMVLFYKKPGFIASVALLLLQSPPYVISIIRSHNLSTIPGLFSSVFTIIMLVIVYISHARIEKQQKRMQNLFEQTSTAMVNAIDAKDTYTHGHSARVAEYSRKLAEMNHKSLEECYEIYYTALLHDVGKIGIPISVINKPGKLTKEEYEMIKQHSAMGAQILESIKEYPYLSIGAHYHHERYDGKGYPEGLKGEEIPEIARIISVADAYDAMTSKRSYRDPIPQVKVREEIVKGVGTQFDPEYARLMLHLIDVDTEYQMKEREGAKELTGSKGFAVSEYRSEVSRGVLITPCKTTVTMYLTSDDEASGAVPSPSLILFDSLDGFVYSDENLIKDRNYFEYGEIWFDGHTETAGARKMQARITDGSSAGIGRKGEYKITAVRIGDHALITILGQNKTAEVTIALPDSTRFLYAALTGEHFCITELNTVKAEEECPADYIPRIAEPVSFIKDAPVGDIPNVQVDGYRTAHSEGIQIRDGLKLTFHAESLPTARLVWHCPFIDLFISDDGSVNSSSYRDLAFMRFDGEFWECDPKCLAKLDVTKTEAFEGWEAWKEFNRSGYEATVTFRTEKNKITIITENAGISIRNTAVFSESEKRVFAAITGDQVAITNIRIAKQ